MKKSHVALVGVGIVLLVAILTNPNMDQHKAVIRSKFTALFQQRLKQTEKSDDDFKNIGAAIGIALGGALVDRIVNDAVTVDNYLLFSLTRVSIEGESKIIGLGAFGNVFISQKVDEALKESAKAGVGLDQ